LDGTEIASSESKQEYPFFVRDTGALPVGITEYSSYNFRGWSLSLLMQLQKKKKKTGNEDSNRTHTLHRETVHQLFTDFKKAYDSVRGAVLYNILIEFGVPMKLVRLIKMC
jgi:hypothetical protein